MELQVVNTLTNGFFLLAGLSVARRAAHPETRRSGVLLVAVAWFSSVYHATSAWGGFLLDIGAMAVWAAHLLAAQQAACQVVGGRFCLLRKPTDRATAAALMGAGAISAPFFAFEVLGADPVTTWNIWANAFLLLMVVATLPSLLQLHVSGLLPRFRARILLAIGSIVAGVVCTQLIHALCVPRVFTAVPLHSGWHLCAALSAWWTVMLVDDVLSEGRGPLARHAASSAEAPLSEC